MEIESIIAALGLAPHPEGGWYRETYRDTLRLPGAALPRGAPRSASTAILYLLDAGSFSALHRIASDEVWHFHLGDPLIVHVLHEDGRREDLRLGRDILGGDLVQAVVPRGAWFGARLAEGGRFALVGCTVAPGFDFADFELAERAVLVARMPEHAALIAAMTRA